MQNRAWATHDEIAAIGDARADALEKQMVFGTVEDMKAHADKIDVIRKNADDMRYAGKMKMAGR